jgi:hypothetical protein
VLSSAASLQRLFPDAVLVGGTAAATAVFDLVERWKLDRDSPT